MDDGTCSELDCDRQVLARGFCSPHYQRLWRAGTLPPNPTPTGRHSVREVDVENRTGVCSICGPVTVRIRTDRRHGRIECQTKGREDRQRRKQQNPRPKGATTPDARLHDRLRRKYGISVEEYQHLVEVQNGRCGICKRPPSPTQRLSVDHDHATGHVRGLLCRKCNLALGFLRDDERALRAAIEWVRRGFVLVPEYKISLPPTG